MVIYLMLFCPLWLPIPLVFKIGFTNDFGTLVRREQALDKEVVWGDFVTLCIVVVPFAHRIEKWFHRKFKPLKLRVYKGNGSTETYNPIAGVIAGVAMLGYWWGVSGLVGYWCGFDGLEWFWLFLKSAWGILLNIWKIFT